MNILNGRSNEFEINVILIFADFASGQVQRRQNRNDGISKVKFSF